MENKEEFDIISDEYEFFKDILPIKFENTPIQTLDNSEYCLTMPIHPEKRIIGFDYLHIFFKDKLTAILFYLQTKDQIQYINLLE